MTTWKTPDGKTHTSEAKANQHCGKVRQQLSDQIRRELTDSEWRNQQIAPASDTRTNDQKMKPFNVKLNSEQSPLQSAIAEAEANLAQQQSRRERQGLTKEESILLTLKQRQAREAELASNEKAEAIHRKSIAPTLAAIDGLIDKERWSTNSDEAFRQQLQQARETLLHPQHDPADLQGRLEAIDSILLERKTLHTADLLQRKAALEATLAQVDSEVGLFEPEKPKDSFTPDPHGYEPPQIDPAKPESERPIVKVEVNREQKPLGIAFDLCEAMEASGSFTDDQVSEVRQAAISGDESAMESVIDRYAV